jgi:hypothetical protein
MPRTHLVPGHRNLEAADFPQSTMAATSRRSSCRDNSPEGRRAGFSPAISLPENGK